MGPYFGRNGAKQYIHGKPLKFGYKLSVMKTPLGYGIQLPPHTGKDTTLQGNSDLGLGLGASHVAHLVNTSPNVGDSNYHIVMDNLLTSPKLLQDLSSKETSVIGALRTNRMKNAPLQNLCKIAKESRGTLDIVTGISLNVTAGRWKDNKVVNALSIFTGKEPFL